MFKKSKKVKENKDIDEITSQIKEKKNSLKSNNSQESDSGVINYLFQREGYCINRYDNGDQYFGYYSNDQKNRQGFYTYNPISLDNKEILHEYYFGNWKNDLRNGNGIYLWLKEDGKTNIFSDFDKSNFRVYVGFFNQNNIERGTYLSKENDNYFIYHGTFSDNNKKEGENCFYYSSNLEILYYGTFKDNYFTEGYVCKFSENGKVGNIVIYTENNIEPLKCSDNEDIILLMTNFRNIIMSKDYFGIVFDVFKSVVNFKSKYVDKVTVNDPQKDKEMIKTTFIFTKITIYKDIEKFIKKIKEE